MKTEVNSEKVMKSIGGNMLANVIRLLSLLIGSSIYTRVLSQRWEMGALSFFMHVFQREGSKILKKLFLRCKTRKRLGEDLNLKGQW